MANKFGWNASPKLSDSTLVVCHRICGWFKSLGNLLTLCYLTSSHDTTPKYFCFSYHLCIISIYFSIILFLYFWISQLGKISKQKLGYQHQVIWFLIFNVRILKFKLNKFLSPNVTISHLFLSIYLSNFSNFTINWNTIYLPEKMKPSLLSFRFAIFFSLAVSCLLFFQQTMSHFHTSMVTVFYPANLQSSSPFVPLIVTIKELS